MHKWDGRGEAERVVSWKMKFSAKLFRALKHHLQVLHHQVQKKYPEGRLRFSVPNGPYQRLAIVRYRIDGNDAVQILARVKARFAAFLEGETVMEDEIAVWHPWFDSSEAVSFLTSLSTRYGLYVCTDRGRLRIYGGSLRQDSQSVCRLLIEKCKELENTHTIVR